MIPYTGTFTVSTYVSTTTSGQQLNILRSNYNDGNTWTTNSPQTTCIVDSGQYCTFRTNHLSLFTFTAPDTTPPSVSLLTPAMGTHLSGSSSFAFTWSGNDNLGISGYTFSIYSGATLITGITTTGTGITLLANVLSYTTSHVRQWQIIATDLAGNTGASSL